MSKVTKPQLFLLRTTPPLRSLPVPPPQAWNHPPPPLPPPRHALLLPHPSPPLPQPLTPRLYSRSPILAKCSLLTQEILLRGVGVMKTTMKLMGRPDLQ